MLLGVEFLVEPREGGCPRVSSPVGPGGGGLFADIPRGSCVVDPGGGGLSADGERSSCVVVPRGLDAL